MYYYIIFIIFQILLLLVLGGKKDFAKISLLFTILFSGLRFETGYDYNVYKSLFENYLNYEAIFEPGFLYIIIFLSYVGMTPGHMFLFFSAATNFLTYKFLRAASINQGFSIILYLIIPGLYLNSFSIIRQALAVSIFSISVYRLLDKNNIYEFLLYAVIASSIHYPALLPYLVTIFIYKIRIKEINNKKIIFMLGLSVLLSSLSFDQFLLSYFIDTKYVAYTSEQASQSTIKIIGTVMVSIFMITHSDTYNKNLKLLFYYKLWVIGMIIYIIFVNITPITRINYYFTLTSIPLYWAAVNSYRGSKKIIIGISVIIFYLLSFINAMYTDLLAEDEIRLIPYKSILFERVL